MSIASEITRLSSAKAALKDAIVAKGVEVADDVKLDGYAEKIAAIPTGGGGLGNGLPIGCPRIDLVNPDISRGECYIVFYTAGATITTMAYMNTTEASSAHTEAREVIVNEDGSVEETDNFTTGRAAQLVVGGKQFCVVRYRPIDGTIVTFFGTAYNGSQEYQIAFLGYGQIHKSVRWIRNTVRADGSSYGYVNGVDATYFEDDGVTTKSVGYASFSSATSSVSFLKANGIATFDALRYMNLERCISFDVGGMDFSACTYAPSFGSFLVNVKMPEDSNKGLRMSFAMTANGLTHTSLMSVINSLYDHASAGTGETPKLTLGTYNLSKLTDAEKKIATDKGWTLA